ncbi:bifunctional metallophosphatase/5'-nucleotidase [Bacillota bacterium Lsc_1132]
METIHIYHTNDLHSHFERWPRIHQWLSQHKKWYQEAGDEVFLFDVGDFVDRWHPLSDATMGKANTELLNKSGYTAVTIGNNEGINLAYGDLDHLYDQAEFDVLTANLYKDNLVYPDWIKPYKVYHTRQGTRVGVIGLTAYFSHLYQLLGWHLTEPIAELKKWIGSLREEADIVILLSHLGIRDDEQIAEEFPEVDVILGGHTHHILQNGKKVKDVLLGAAGKHGNFVGHMVLVVDKQKKIAHKKAYLYDVNELPAPSYEQDEIEALYQKGKSLLSRKVTDLQAPLENDPFRETELARMLCQTLRKWCEADCSFLNAGLLLGPLEGEVTEYDLLTVCPHPINPCKVELTGSELQEVLLQTNNPEWPHKQIFGFGFRGTIMGIFIYDQIDFNDNHKIYINGEELDPKGQYTLAVPDMFTFGRFFPEIYISKNKKYYLPEFLRDLLKWKLQGDI